MGNRQKIIAPPFQHYFRIDVLVLQLIGLPTFNTVFTTNKLSSRWWNGYYFYVVMPMIFFILLCQLTTIFYVRPGLDFTVEVLSSLCTLAASAVKGIRWWTHRHELYHILQKLSIHWENARTQNYLTIKNLKAAENARFFRSVYLFSVGFSYFTFALRPYMMYLSYQLQRDNNHSFSFSDMTIIPAVYPVTIESFEKFFIVVSYQQIAGTFLCMYWASSDSLFIQLMSHISIQFEVLAKRLENIVKINDGSKHDDYVHQELENIAEQHHQLYLYCQLSEDIYNPIIFLTVVSNGISLCSCLYLAEDQLSSLDWSQASKFITHLITLSIQTIIYCGYADHLSQNSTLISRAAYRSQWIKWNQRNKKTLVIIMMRSGEEYQYTAYGMIILNFKQVTTIVNGAMSYFMLLKRFR